MSMTQSGHVVVDGLLFLTLTEMNGAEMLGVLTPIWRDETVQPGASPWMLAVSHCRNERPAINCFVRWVTSLRSVLGDPKSDPD